MPAAPGGPRRRTAGAGRRAARGRRQPQNPRTGGPARRSLDGPLTLRRGHWWPRLGCRSRTGADRPKGGCSFPVTVLSSPSRTCHSRPARTRAAASGLSVRSVVGWWPHVVTRSVFAIFGLQDLIDKRAKRVKDLDKNSGFHSQSTAAGATFQKTAFRGRRVHSQIKWYSKSKIKMKSSISKRREDLDDSLLDAATLQKADDIQYSRALERWPGLLYNM